TANNKQEWLTENKIWIGLTLPIKICHTIYEFILVQVHDTLHREGTCMRNSLHADAFEVPMLSNSETLVHRDVDELHLRPTLEEEQHAPGSRRIQRGSGIAERQGGSGIQEQG
ncbi:hypothetical protein ACJX0J_031519, partial [Zea mays]